jgi:5'-3' exonuclease
MNTKNLIIDGTNISFRYYYVTRNEKKNNNQGKSIEIIVKYLNGIFNFITKFNPDIIYAAWDKKISYKVQNYRQQLMNGAYKANRTKPNDVDQLYDQEERLIKILETLGVKNFYPNTLEADDVVAYLVNKIDGDTIVVSVDQDLLQLVNKRVSVWNLKTLITESNFKENIGIERELYNLYKAIKGDDADGIDGIPGYGKIKAARLAKIWNTSTISDNYKNIVDKNMKLMDLSYGIKVESGELISYDKQFEQNELTISNRDKFIQICANENIPISINEWNKIFSRNNIVNIINGISYKYLKGV